VLRCFKGSQNITHIYIVKKEEEGKALGATVRQFALLCPSLAPLLLLLRRGRHGSHGKPLRHLHRQHTLGYGEVRAPKAPALGV
jgi:hypothetical protein